MSHTGSDVGQLHALAADDRGDLDLAAEGLDVPAQLSSRDISDCVMSAAWASSACVTS
jgi:hypothetical protein